ncbi:MAG: ABC transporter permease [Anaerolineae bacterium]|nr:ABC transporter permease [Anaerolineae bacterium]
MTVLMAAGRMIVIIWLAATLTFFLLRLHPGDAVEAQLIQVGAASDVIAERRSQLGLLDPLWLQYLRFCAGLLQGNLGVSLITGQLVSEMIIQRLPPTLELAFSAGILGSVLGVLGGVGAAVKLPYGLSWVAKINLSLALSVPIYWSGTMALLAVSYALPTGSGAEISRFVLPVLVLAFHMSGAVGQMVSTNIRLAMDMDFVRTAHAKGLRPVIILWRHVLRLGLLPTITVIGLQIGFLLGGAVIIESLFVRAGLGRLLLESTLQQDYPVVQGIVVLAAAVYAVVLSTCEALYRLIDPRITR